MKILTDEEVAKIVDPVRVVEAVEKAYILYSLGRVVMPVRSKVEAHERGDILMMPCLVPEMNIFSLKLVTVYPKNLEKDLPTINATVIVLDAETGMPKIVAEARALTGLRTAAATAVSIKHLARKDFSKIGIIGTGYQARWQLRVTAANYPGTKFSVFDIDGRRMKEFVDEMSREGFDVKQSSSAEEVVRNSDIVITVTTSKTPVISDGWVREGTHISAIGGYTPEMVEIDPKLTARSKLVVDSREAVKEEAGDVLKPVELGLMKFEDIYAEIGEVAAGLKPGRTDEKEVTVFKSVGLAVQDAAASKILLDYLMTR
ncbi:MAG: ornithine cyclodeaminase family protein [Candidatus Caldarchaeum sp.]|nr:ornithine cyclodeaminase family protein [Candidatus Caldarchaeum sp.]